MSKTVFSEEHTKTTLSCSCASFCTARRISHCETYNKTLFITDKYAFHLRKREMKCLSTPLAMVLKTFGNGKVIYGYTDQILGNILIYKYYLSFITLNHTPEYP